MSRPVSHDRAPSRIASAHPYVVAHGDPPRRGATVVLVGDEDDPAAVPLRAVAGVSTPDRPGPPDRGPQLSEILAPFVAWLATQDLGESERRRHRDAAERFLRWSHADGGPVEERRRRYEWHVRHQNPDHLGDAQSGLNWWAHYRWIVSCTLPTDC